ncbi:zinc ABC transporter permease subunit ZnuB [Bermanella marisrubri]|uniref:High-affinity zinc uptake system membrane protein ZnuB n=1 Tax=Bermanella marisrubri TaxID=207949 RepID=Q1MZ74_9GAMM|nr:zinc ABC transporter permease subunit ZnuB [Bermanella marisrubri]EAT11259.1 high-affinity zinc uptake system membrane protein ZnuB [Oceanobacter sp. RED65] [Bermanella marisrubri]QIZ82742.1 zinc ABC transporter permease subunit ZnuB [Bermanella marisrubri]
MLWLLDALLAGWLLSLMSGPLGSFIVWRRMAYFGDTLAHSALLGVTLGFLMDVQLNIAIILCAIFIAVLLANLQRQQLIPSDTLLGLMAHTTLAAGLVTLSMVDNVRIDLNSYLFGDLLAVSRQDLYSLAIGSALVLAAIIKMWRGLLAASVSEELAEVEGYNVARLRLMFMVLLAIVIAGAMKLVGVLLITALLIIPAAAARPFSRHPQQMAFIATILSMISVALGLGLSYQWDTPAGPSVVLASAIIFLISQSAFQLSKRNA